MKLIFQHLTPARREVGGIEAGARAPGEHEDGLAEGGGEAATGAATLEDAIREADAAAKRIFVERGPTGAA